MFYDKDLSKLAKLMLYIIRTLRFIRVTEKLDEGKICYESSNFTIINFYLTIMGPTREDKLTRNLMIIQVNLHP